MYTKSARYYDALYHFKDYRAASEELHSRIQQIMPGAKDLLDVACGTGQHLEFLRDHYSVAGLDINEDLLKIARQRCPGVPFYQGDMADFHLNKTFDVVTCLFSAIAYVKYPELYEAAVQRMAEHVNPNGILFIEPFFTPDQYWTNHLTANVVDQPDIKICWMYRMEREGNIGIFNIHYMVLTQNGVDHFQELHEVGLFTTDQYVSALKRAGLTVSWDPKGLFGRGMYIGVKKTE